MRLAPIFSFKIIAICLLLLNSNLSLAQSNSNYLQLLEGEANNLTLDSQTTIKKNSPLGNATSNIGDSTNTLNADGNIPQGLSFEDFMANLKVNYIGTYFFAKRLSAKNQNEIYTFYQSNNDPQAIRTHVIKISKKN